MARETLVFISYARADEQYANDLMTRLKNEPDVVPWQDRISMSPGDFEEQIKQGIESARHFVLVMTPAALLSPWVEKEWRYARESGRCIVPIKPEFDSAETDAELERLRATLPVWMQKIQTYDFKSWRRFVEVLLAPCQATRAPFLAANVPPNYVHRPEEFGRLLDAVLDAGHRNPSGKTVVLHGIGGFGKTTLALSLCHNPDVFAACDGGILWVTLGEQPSIATELELIYAALTGDRPGFKNQDDAMFEVAKKLDGKRCLLVIDDVWNAQDVKPFLYGGASCSRLITTRIFSVAVSAASDAPSRISVAEPTGNEADRILSTGLDIPAASTPQVRVLTDRLKRVPLLLQLANRALFQRLALGQNPDEALRWALQQYEDLGVVAFDEKDGKEPRDARQQQDARNTVEKRRTAVGKTVEVSLGFLADERQRCLELGILHEDTDVPFSVLGTLWDLRDAQVQTLAQRTHDIGLVKMNLPGRSIRMHDYIREYLERILPEPARVHGRLVDAWKGARQLPGGYPVQHVVFHLVESLKDTSHAVQRATQLIDLLTDERFQRYQRKHGDATALDRKLTLAIARAAESNAPEVPALIASLVLLRKSYAANVRDAALVFETAAQGRITAAAELLTLFEADRHWDTLARLLIAWLAPADRTDDARAFAEETAKSCDTPHLRKALEWVRQAPDGTPAGLQPISGSPNLRHISAILQRAGGSEALEGLEPLNYEDLISGTDATGFIAERDGPDLVAFAKLDPTENTQYLERYIEIHAANRYVHYRNRSLWTLLQSILEFPDPAWVRQVVQRIVTAALTVTSVEFEEFLPFSIRAVRAHGGDALAGAVLEERRQQLLSETAALRPHEGRTDSWSHYHRRASALAENCALALGRPGEAADLLALARELPKGFAGFRAASALTLAESTRIVAPADRAARDAALTSATAASHRIQDHRFCLQVTAMVNAMRMRWAEIPAGDLQAIVGEFLANPLKARFCALHRVQEEFEYRAEDQQHFQALPIPDAVRRAATLREIAEAFDYEPEPLSAVNDWIWDEPRIEQVLQKGDLVNIPDPEFVPVLAARFAAEALAADGLGADQRSLIIQRLVRLALPKPTALDTVLGRLMLSTLQRPADMPEVLRMLQIPGASTPMTNVESYR